MTYRERELRDMWKAISTWVLICASMFVVIGAFSVFDAYMESKTYNRLTGAHTTWWDALWVELRVMEPTNVNTNR